MPSGPNDPTPADRRPVRLIVGDDLNRRRLTVFFRLLMALPHLLWLALWSIAALFAAIANWIAALFQGSSQEPLHGFLARFVRYATHVYAYISLAAEPFPRFGGQPDYPVDLEIDPPARQNRWTIFFRLVLAIPALLLLSILTNSNFEESEAGFATGAGLLSIAAFFGWFYALARGEMARGLRDAVAWVISYGAQTWAYLLILTDRYPSIDPLTAIGPLPLRDDPVQLDAAGDDLRRSRLTVFFRLPLAIPHLVWLTLWGIAVFFAVIANWFATLFTATSPQGLHRFISAYLRYQLHVMAYLYLVGNPFPGFVGKPGSYPVELRIAERARQNRWTVFFRLLLAIPAFLLAGAYGSMVAVVALFGWFVSLFTGRMPEGLRNAGAQALRYMSQTHSYLVLVTGAYPYSGPCLAPTQAPPPPAAVVPPRADAR
ncbi:MAG TPA: DUF4389 domain-containing protein [Solirubrobacterales bacterium]|nr:DUF4389 domain-containing protein [Solirubrobacterales bacterium]